MATTQAHVDALEKALYSGALSVQSPDVGFITYRSVGELMKAIDYAKANLSSQSGTSLTAAPSFATYSKD